MRGVAGQAELACVGVPGEFGELGVWRVCEEGIGGLSGAEDGSVGRADGKGGLFGDSEASATSVVGRLPITDWEWMARR